MIVIIRLKNLPWTADSDDIRRYFAGLSIPEGHVIIVGGVIGEAFIGFSTDEDARLAMMKDGGEIHQMQIKLLLSSQLEMTRVVKEARQENGTLLETQAVIPLQPSPFPVIPVIRQQHNKDSFLPTRTMTCPGPVRGNRAHMNRASRSPFERPLRRTETGTVGNRWR